MSQDLQQGTPAESGLLPGTPSVADQKNARPNRRFAWTVAAFAVANVLAWVVLQSGVLRWPMPAGAVAANQPAAALAVTRFMPGDSALLSPTASLTWTFEADVATPGPCDAPPATLTPAVPGRWSWADARTLTFTPAEAWPRATAFTATLPPGAVRVIGSPDRTLAVPHTATVRTAGLELIGVRHVGRADGQPILELSFNDAVVPADVLKHLQVSDASAADAPPAVVVVDNAQPAAAVVTAAPSAVASASAARPIELFGQASGKTVRVRCLPPLNSQHNPSPSQLVVTARKGLVGLAGPLGLSADVSLPVGISRELQLTESSSFTSAGRDPTVTLRFNDDVDPQQIRQVLKVEPAVPIRVSRLYDHAVQVSGPFVPGSRYVLSITPPPAGATEGFPKPTVVGVYIDDRPSAVWFEHDAGYLGSAGNRTVLAKAVNVPAVRVGVIRVYDNQLVAWRNADRGRRRYYESDRLANFARPIASRRIVLGGEKNRVQDVRLSLDELLPPQQRGDGVYRLTLSPESADDRSAPAAVNYGPTDDEPFDFSAGSSATVVTLSDIGLSVRRGGGSLQAWAVSLQSAKPLANVRVRAYSDKGQLLGTASTNADGLAELAHVRTAPGETPAVVLADQSAVAGDAAAPVGLTWLDLRTSERTHADSDTAGRPYLRDGYEAFVYTDRGVYRPGETVHLRAIVRGPAQAVPPSFPLKWQFRRPDLREWTSQMTPLDGDGAAGVTLTLPADLPTGRWTAQVGLPGETSAAGAVFGSVTFLVEEFLPERIKASARFDPARRVTMQTPLELRLQADYLFGKPAAELPAQATALAEPVQFASPKWRGWTFGDAGRTAEAMGVRPVLARRQDLDSAVTSAAGEATWKFPTAAALLPPQASMHRGPWRVTAAASVSETGGRAVSVSATADIDTADAYLALRSTIDSPAAHQPVTFDVAMVSPQGDIAPRAARLTATLFRQSWNNSLVRENGRYRYESSRLLEPVGDPLPVRLQAGRGTVTLKVAGGGAYVLRVSDADQSLLASISFHATEPFWQDSVSQENPESLELSLLPPLKSVPLTELGRAISAGDLRSAGRLAADAVRGLAAAAAERDPAAPSTLPVGSKPRVMIRSPFAGRMLLSVETDRVVWQRVIEMPASQAIVPIDVTDACRPNAYVTATVVRAVDPNATWRAHRASGVLRLPVDSGDRQLRVRVESPTDIRPESTLAGQVVVTDGTGRPAPNVAVTVAVVDEGILQLTKFATPSPLGYFMGTRALGVRVADLYGMLMPEVPRPDGRKAVGGDGDADVDAGRHASPVSARRVQSVALFTGVLRTDARGAATFDVPVGAFAGKLRVMAVAYTGPAADHQQFGSAEAFTLVRSPVLVQSSFPRFTAPGDRLRVPVKVFNTTASAATARVTISLEGINGPSPLRLFGDVLSQTLPAIELPAGGERTMWVELAALPTAGVSRVQVRADMGAEAFTETLELPVRPGSPETTTGGFAVATPAEPASVQPPADILLGTRQLQVRVTPWPVMNLPQGLQYLDRYPYGCAEQTTSGAFPLIALGELGESIAPGMFDRQRVSAKLQSGILRLSGMQCADGGVGMWNGNGSAWPWASVYAAHLLVEAEAAGHAVPADFRDRLFAYCRDLLDQPSDSAERIETQAYACYVLSLAGKPPRATMNRLNELLARSAAPNDPEAVRLATSSARPHLAMALVAAGRRDLAAALIPTVLPEHRGSRELGGNVASPVRDRAILLSAMVSLDADRPEVAALAQQIAQAGVRGEWRSTQETAAALCALARYQRSQKPAAPYESVELWAGGKAVARADAGGALAWDLPAGEAVPTDLQVRVFGDAGGKAFVSWLQHGVPLTPPAHVDSGLQVRRRYLDRNGREIDLAKVASGELLQVEVSISAPRAMQNIVVDDLLPAGLEIENGRLASGSAAVGLLNDDAGQTARQARNPLRTALISPRDDRMVFVGEMESAGTGRFVYVARAVTAGSFLLPPVRAECMYDPGIHSLWGTGKMTVLPAK